MELIFTKESHWLDKWDKFVQTEDKASHLLLSDWNKSFISYGFDFEVCILLDNDSICGGYVGVIAKVSLFKFYIVPFGPIVTEGHEKHLDSLIKKVHTRAKLFNCCYCHITIPFSVSENKHINHSLPKFKSLDEAKQGHLFKYVYSSYGINWKSVEGFANEEMLINSFKPSVRRYIRSSQRKNLELRLLETEEAIKNAYDLCLKNAKENGYALREWSSFKSTLLQLIKTDKAKFLGAFFQDTIKGASLIVKAGNHYTYILGGTIKEKPDFLAGHFLHYAGIRMAFEEHLSGYNISLGGSEGVVNLKNSYADEQVYFYQGQFHWVIKPFYFNLFLFFEKYLKSHKKSIAKILSLLKK